MRLNPVVLVPLYIYPDPGAWNPLYNVIQQNPSLNFTVVVNPSSGPGSKTYPPSEYITGVKTLNGYANVKTVGYVATNYTQRSQQSVIADINKYAGWQKSSSKITLHGIFFDEVVYNYTQDAANYMKQISQAVKSVSTGFLRDNIVIHNPGVIPDAGLVNSQTDVTVVFEEAYTQYAAQRDALNSLPISRQSLSYLVHSIPTTIGQGELQSFVGEIGSRAQYLFLTSNSKNYYGTFGSGWTTMINALASASADDAPSPGGFDPGFSGGVG